MLGGGAMCGLGINRAIVKWFNNVMLGCNFVQCLLSSEFRVCLLKCKWRIFFLGRLWGTQENPHFHNSTRRCFNHRKERQLRSQPNSQSLNEINTQKPFCTTLLLPDDIVERNAKPRINIVSRTPMRSFINILIC